jgi:hypothetical protein
MQLIPLPITHPHPDDPCYEMLIRIYEGTYPEDEEDEQTEPLYEED